ncbi:DUF2878 domain-containing protein [Vibrio gallaecicus]|uniref:DUF2878 domain-containing protein n=1 Tax=Vibrio gallaecicus TaxID=552386 RepID=UPI0010CA0137|nr:DUF2878 domain-containing protein [Vibrio gallaecicus]MDN3616175.1 DUF2878 domain-containing protein [Vibrio gallaecicus]
MKRFWIINLVLFQAAWLCSAFYTEQAWWVVSVIIALHFALSPTKQEDLKLLLLLPVGIAMDSLQLSIGGLSALPLETSSLTTTSSLLVGEEVANLGFHFPAWLVMIWVLFLISLNHSLHWLVNRSTVTLIVIGAIGGTSSYWGGIQAGALQTNWQTEWMLASLMIGWGALLPILVSGYNYLQKPMTFQPQR